VNFSKWLFRGFGAALAFLVLGLGRAQSPSGSPSPIGELVNVGSYRIHLYCAGAGEPAVIITGAGYSFDWSLVQPEVAKFTRVCAYDHSGTTWSDSGPRDTCSLRVSEIHAALQREHILGPYVLVGHSLGALVSRLYAAKYASEVAGMVMVDHATQFVKIGLSQGRSAAPGILPSSRGLPPVAKIRPDPDADFQKLPEPDYQLHLWADAQPRFAQVMKRDLEMVSECSDEVEAATQNKAVPLGDRPLVAVSQPATEGLHEQLLALSSDSKLVVAAGSGHSVMLDRPDVVIEAIREAVDAARNHARLKQ
jgi:pimeloyl-ACP methyl ester carboxylesterase